MDVVGVPTKPTALPLCADRQRVLVQEEHDFHQNRTGEGVRHGPQKQPHRGPEPGRQAPRPFRPRGFAPAVGDDTVLQVYIKGLPFPVVLAKQVFTNKDGITGVIYLASSDLQSTY